MYLKIREKLKQHKYVCVNISGYVEMISDPNINDWDPMMDKVLLNKGLWAKFSNSSELWISKDVKEGFCKTASTIKNEIPCWGNIESL